MGARFLVPTDFTTEMEYNTMNMLDALNGVTGECAYLGGASIWLHLGKHGGCTPKQRLKW